MRSKKQSEPNGLYMEVCLDHQVVGQAIFERLVATQLDGHGERVETIWWKVKSILIAPHLRPWQQGLLLDYLPTVDETISWLDPDNDTVNFRLVSCVKKWVAARKHELTFGEAKLPWQVRLEERELSGEPYSAVASVSGELEIRVEDGFSRKEVREE